MQKRAFERIPTNIRVKFFSGTEEILKVPAKIISFRKADKIYNGIGIVLLNPSQNYLKFVDSLRTAL
jgi:hypothetical protein